MLDVEKDYIQTWACFVSFGKASVLHEVHIPNLAKVLPLEKHEISVYKTTDLY